MTDHYPIIPPARTPNPLSAALRDLVGVIPGWMDGALCAQVDPESFFPDKGGATREIKAICRGCDVRTQCLQYALEHHERFGIWGGLSVSERERLLGKKGRAA